jgi:hypothetical protein
MSFDTVSDWLTDARYLLHEGGWSPSQAYWTLRVVHVDTTNRDAGRKTIYRNCANGEASM